MYAITVFVYVCVYRPTSIKQAANAENAFIRNIAFLDNKYNANNLVKNKQYISFYSMSLCKFDAHWFSALQAHSPYPQLNAKCWLISSVTANARCYVSIVRAEPLHCTCPQYAHVHMVWPAVHAPRMIMWYRWIKMWFRKDLWYNTFTFSSTHAS